MTRRQRLEAIRAERDLEVADFVDDYAAALERGLPLAQNPVVHSDEVRGLLVVGFRGLASSIRAGLVDGGEMCEAAE